MTNQTEENLRVQIEHKKHIMEQYKKTGKKPEELKKVEVEIEKLTELLKQFEEQGKGKEVAFEYPKRER